MSHVLLIDDEEAVLDGWRLILRPLRLNVVEARDEPEAVAACSETPFDLVIADYIVGSSTGLRIIHRIRKKLPLVRTILISGRIEKTLSKEELKEIVKERVEVDEYLHKPVRPKVLREKVTSLLQVKTPEWKEIVRKARQAREVDESAVDEAEDRLRKHIK